MTGLPFDLVKERGPQLGLVVLQSDETIEGDMRRLLPPEAELLVSRIPSAEDVTRETLAAMEDHLISAASLFPRAARFAAVGYGCTSGTAQIGAARIASLIGAGCRTGAVTEPVSALIAACARLGIARLAFVSPYVRPVSAHLMEVLEEAGITITAFGSFEEAEEARVVRIAPASIEAAALEVAGRAECDAIFLSCTNLRTLDVIAATEAATGRPTLSSNLVLAWDLMRRADLSPPNGNPGRLWSRSAL